MPYNGFSNIQTWDINKRLSQTNGIARIIEIDTIKNDLENARRQWNKPFISLAIEHFINQVDWNELKNSHT